MSFHSRPRRHPDIGRVAMRLLTIPVMSIAILAVYIGLKMSVSAQPASASAGGPAASAAEIATVQTPAIDAPAVDEATLAHQSLDPVGAGRHIAP